jgi:23S rRNA (adenine2503-C2)-methyltransferase
MNCAPNADGLKRAELLSFSRAELADQFAEWSIARGHATTVWRALHRDGVADLADIAGLPPAAQATLVERGRIDRLTVVRETISDDGQTRKYLLGLGDRRQIETVLMLAGRRATVCVSSQVGCALGCVFCATGQMGFERNLTAGEIVAQVHFARRELQRWAADDECETPPKLTNVVLMGMGEPLLNYDAVMTALENLCDPGGLAIGFKQATVSTVGVVPGIRRFTAERRPYSLAVSLHGATQAKRLELLPAAKTWPLDELLDACREYSRTLRRRIFLEWTVIEGANSAREQAAELVRLLAGLDVQVNLIPLNPTTGYDGAPAARGELDAFRETLQTAKIPVSIRQRRGIEIAAGCGQLAAAALS